MQRRVTLRIAAALIFAVGALPLAVMLAQSLTVDGRVTLELYAQLFSAGDQWRLMQHSLTLAALVTLLSVAIGVPLGIVLGKTDLLGRVPLLVAICLPLLIPLTSWRSPGSICSRRPGCWQRRWGPTASRR